MAEAYRLTNRVLMRFGDIDLPPREEISSDRMRIKFWKAYISKLEHAMTTSYTELDRKKLADKIPIFTKELPNLQAALKQLGVSKRRMFLIKIGCCLLEYVKCIVCFGKTICSESVMDVICLSIEGATYLKTEWLPELKMKGGDILNEVGSVETHPLQSHLSDRSGFESDHAGYEDDVLLEDNGKAVAFGQYEASTDEYDTSKDEDKESSDGDLAHIPVAEIKKEETWGSNDKEFDCIKEAERTCRGLILVFSLCARMELQESCGFSHRSSVIHTHIARSSTTLVHFSLYTAHIATYRAAITPQKYFKQIKNRASKVVKESWESVCYLLDAFERLFYLKDMSVVKTVSSSVSSIFGYVILFLEQYSSCVSPISLICEGVSNSAFQSGNSTGNGNARGSSQVGSPFGLQSPPYASPSGARKSFGSMGSPMGSSYSASSALT
ncbi:hypothetical protein ADUPG1_000538, partial [Aduncisulcus paluster]